MNIRPFKFEDEERVISLWERCGLLRPRNDPRKDIQRKLRAQPELFLVAEFGGAVVASVMAGYEGHRGWVYYLAVSPDCHRHGLGRAIMNHVERLLIERGCPKINLQVRASNESVLAFYRHTGYSTDDAVSLGKRLQHDRDE